MANLNKVMLIGRLTNDPEMKTFGANGKVCKFNFAVNNRWKNQQTGQWVDEPAFIPIEAFGKSAEMICQYLSKGKQVFIDGHLKFDQWNDKATGQKRSSLKVVVDNVQFLDAKSGGGQQHQQSNNDDSYGEPVGANSAGPDVPF